MIIYIYRDNRMKNRTFRNKMKEHTRTSLTLFIRTRRNAEQSNSNISCKLRRLTNTIFQVQIAESEICVPI